MGLTPSPVHMRPPEPDPLRVDVINGWPLIEISILKKWTSRSFAICLRTVGSRNLQFPIKYFKYCKKNFRFIHVVKISANSEMVEREPLLILVELSWNDPFFYKR